ncbi:hypothetical protein ISREJYDI_CDS0067 [Pseudomonas phage UNO-G1W1]|uniref:Uncharacterized protein n=1 Tax=Pseudomonas phage UNO-G1W1 TaxID=3136609 RepID=A0AAX4MVD5_9CAUD
MTQRNEPSVGAFEFAGLFGGKKAAVKTPEQLMNDALKGFEDAAAAMGEAQKAIDLQAAEHEAEIAKRQKQLAEAQESSSRLGRVAERFAELLK